MLFKTDPNQRRPIGFLDYIVIFGAADGMSAGIVGMFVGTPGSLSFFVLFAALWWFYEYLVSIEPKT